MRLNAYAVSHVGNVRSKNEDNLFFNNMILKKANKHFCFGKSNLRINKPVYLGVFDGMGGMSDGDKASYIAATTTKQIIKNKNKNVIETLEKICVKANENICQEMKGVNKLKMGATLSMLSFQRDNYYLCNVGDSPILLFRDHKISEISHEHTEKDNLELFGNKQPEKKKYKLTQHLGIPSEEMEIEPYFSKGRLLLNDKFIICSDGLTDMVDYDDIKQCLQSEKSIKKAVKSLLEKALKNGGKDNITIIGIDVKKGFEYGFKY